MFWISIILLITKLTGYQKYQFFPLTRNQSVPLKLFIGPNGVKERINYLSTYLANGYNNASGLKHIAHIYRSKLQKLDAETLDVVSGEATCQYHSHFSGYLLALQYPEQNELWHKVFLFLFLFFFFLVKQNILLRFLQVTENSY